MVDGWQKLTSQYYIALSCLTNNLYKDVKFNLKNYYIIHDFLFFISSRKIFIKQGRPRSVGRGHGSSAITGEPTETTG